MSFDIDGFWDMYGDELDPKRVGEALSELNEASKTIDLTFGDSAKILGYKILLGNRLSNLTRITGPGGFTMGCVQEKKSRAIHFCGGCGKKVSPADKVCGDCGLQLCNQDRVAKNNSRDPARSIGNAHNCV